MNTRQFVLRETGLLTIGLVLCAGVTVGVFALIGQYDMAVLLGAVIGVVLASGNFFLMAVAAEAAADRAMQEDVKGGKAIVKTSRNMRLIGLFAIIFLLAKTGVCNAICLVLPLLLVRPVLLVVEFFRKAGDGQK